MVLSVIKPLYAEIQNLQKYFNISYKSNCYKRTIFFFQPKWILKMIVSSIARFRIPLMLSFQGYKNMQGCLILEAPKLSVALYQQINPWPVQRRRIRDQWDSNTRSRDNNHFQDRLRLEKGYSKVVSGAIRQSD